MKKIILTAILGTSLLSASAQVIRKGQRILGGSFSLGFVASDPDNGNNNQDQQKQWSVGLAPSFGKAVKDNRVFGYRLSLNASGSHYERSGQSVAKNSGRGAGAGIFWERFIPVTRQLYFSLPISLDANYQFNENRQFNMVTDLTKRNTYGASISIDPTISYALNPKFLLQLGTTDLASLYFNRIKEERTGTIGPLGVHKYSEYGLQSSLNNNYSLAALSLSVRYIF